MRDPAEEAGGVRVYVDTSVFGGVYDEEFESASREFFEQVADGRFTVVTSPVVDREIGPAPLDVQRLYMAVVPLAEVVPVTDEVERLARAFIRAGVVRADSEDDALHVALATVHGCDLLVSWDFKHLVHYRRVPLFQAVSRAEGYTPVPMHSPLEVIQYDDEDI